MYLIVHTIHLLAAFTYGGFLFTDNLFMSKMGQSLGDEESKRAREAIMMHVRKVVPYALLVTVGTGIYMFPIMFGSVGDDGLTKLQIVLLIKAFFGLWLGIRGGNQLFFKIDPFVFKSHKFPFYVVILIIILSQVMQS